MNLAEWREWKWGGPCHSPATNEEHAEYGKYLQTHSGIKPIEELW